MPFLFEKIEDYTELLFPDKLLHTGSVLNDLNSIIPDEDWQEVEIIGWIYQDYIAPKKDKVFADLKKNIKISKENIPRYPAFHPQLDCPLSCGKLPGTPVDAQPSGIQPC